MASFGPRDLAAMAEAREKVNADRQATLHDIPRLRAQLRDMHADPDKLDEGAMKEKYSYLYQASPTMFKLLGSSDFPIDQMMKMLGDIERVGRRELSNVALGENIVKSFVTR